MPTRSRRGRQQARCTPSSWRGGDVAVLAAAAVALPGLLGLLLTTAVGWSDGTLLATPIGVLLVVALARRRGLGAADLGLRRPCGAWASRAVGLGVALVALNVGLGLALRAAGVAWLAGLPAHAQATAAVTPAGLAGALLTAAVVVPAEEELLFRGILQGGLTARFGLVVGLPVGALAFLLAHGPHMGAFHLVAGLAYGVVAHRSGSIAPAVVLHAVNNAVVVLLVALPQG